jgi:Uma2 family endonuclease
MGISTKFTHADLLVMPDDGKWPEYWIVDAEQRAVEVFRLKEQGYWPAQTLHGQEALTSPLLPGFSLGPRDIFSSQ